MREDDVKIVRLTDVEAFKQLEILQSQIWGRSEVIPYHLLIAFQNMGGAVFVAYDKQDKPIGILFGYTSYVSGEVFFYMHAVGILPEHAGSNLSINMILELRKHLLQEGIEYAKWFIDPLNVNEAYLSIHKLGGIKYQRNLYGFMRDPYNRGLESDRILVEWDLESERVINRVSSIDKECEYSSSMLEKLDKSIVAIEDGHLLKILDYKLSLNSDKILAELPSNIEMIKKKDPSVALEWREVSRKIFERYLSRGYVVADVLKDPCRKICYYLLEKRE
ncbi:MAG: hypothetical protein QW095_03095 [Nitrososphaerota archaeon]